MAELDLDKSVEYSNRPFFVHKRVILLHNFLFIERTSVGLLQLTIARTASIQLDVTEVDHSIK